MKTDNPILGECTCDACGNNAGIKRKRTGKKLLYLHCPNCGLDQRSGALIQAKWQAIIDGVELPSEKAEKIAELQPISTETASEIKTEVTPEISENWQPDNNIEKVMKNDNSGTKTRPDKSEQESSESSGGILKIFGAIAGIALVIAKTRS
ncbi:hypothetical protein [Thalassotalea profundi]|uniref:Uncharacterized protein n=1 Tax=Thalassotalea profundi TaxID=2036687 RepID=A0ABQ3IKV2_9GAMM|nr:hypothetical protein [Thalassotalea profundi]GHE87420.1 hypothetical protein GCM10011501_16100 [Thalassotalea profundi]